VTYEHRPEDTTLVPFHIVLIYTLNRITEDGIFYADGNYETVNPGDAVL
jgi:hypothetical protein